MSEKTYFITRRRSDNVIIRVESIPIKRHSVEHCKKVILENNSTNKEWFVEITEDKDFVSIIEIAEENKRTKIDYFERAFKEIEGSFENLRTDIYDLNATIQQELDIQKN